jgi:RNA polymerase sigma-70 factor (ECF subfamily)
MNQEIADSDLKLIRRVKSGEAQAFDVLMQRYATRIYQVIYGMVHNQADTQDLSQETFIHAYEGIKGFNEKYRFYTWLYRIAINLCINHWKRRKPAQLVPIENGESYADPNPATDPAAMDLRRAVEKRLAQLPEEQKTVFVLRTFEEMSYQEIAEVLGISIGTVMSRLSRAREKLKELLKDYLPRSAPKS